MSKERKNREKITLPRKGENKFKGKGDADTEPIKWIWILGKATDCCIKISQNIERVPYIWPVR